MDMLIKVYIGVSEIQGAVGKSVVERNGKRKGVENKKGIETDKWAKAK